ncbi:MAG: D-alanyl-D-alanine carboxypeptidase [Bacteroidota bacterium]
MKRTTTLLNQLLIFNYSLLILSSCSIEKQIAKSAKADVLGTKALQTAHVGISIFEPATNKYLYSYQGDKYFVPASNTKLPTCYAAMKYLGDSLVGLRYGIPEEKYYQDKLIVVQPTGDPTLLHTDYIRQPVYDFLEKRFRNTKIEMGWMDTIWKEAGWGSGWSWNDYEEPYMAERSPLPIYGNTISITLNEVKDRNINEDYYEKNIKLFKTGISYFDSLVNKNTIQTISRGQFKNPIQKWIIRRSIERNIFSAERSEKPFSSLAMAFVANGASTAMEILEQSFNKRWGYSGPLKEKNAYYYDCYGCDGAIIHISQWFKIHSQPTDSLLKPMMHRSDNFFAEQSLLMVSNERLGIMNDEKIIDTLLKTDFKDLPQKPRWVDGSGLSRYNLFTPQDFVAILNKMKNEFGMERIKVILPTGGEGTISNYYKADSGYIYGKTGTLSGVVAFSGFLYTKKGKLLIFSTLVNNHQASAAEVRKAMEKFLQGIRNRY